MTKKNEDDNVISIFGRQARELKAKQIAEKLEVEEPSFFNHRIDEVQEQNKKKAERMKKDRENKNKYVLRSYRIKS